jgi:hypothetical protein
MATIHFIQQGKGGVGKSVIASFLYQVLHHQGKDVVAFDTDPVNATLMGYREFTAVQVDIVRQGQVDTRAFDELLEGLYNLPEDSHAVVDNGASSFLALGNYMKDIGLIQLLEEKGHQVFFHSVVTGGQAIGDTITGLKVLADGFPATPIVVWLNPFFGEIRLDGKEFEEFKIYQEYASQFHAIIQLPHVNKDTLGRDLEELFAKRQSFEIAIASCQYIAVRSRLKRYWEQLIAIVEQAGITG